MLVKLIKYLLAICYSFLKFFIKKRNIILINAHHNEVYCDNTKYLFEHISINTDYEIYWVSIFLSVSGVILMISKFSNNNSIKLTYFYAFIIGLFQAVAILPGVSRSGMTIGIALLLGVSKKEASKFSFLIAIPIIIGAVLLELIKVEDIHSLELINLTIGFVVAGISGYLSINWLIKLIDKSHFWKFSFYLWIVSFIIYYV